MIAEYDKIAELYKEAATEKRNHRKYVLIPTFLHFLKDVKNKPVLDLACGEGFWTRIIKEKGAAKVIGIDISTEMIKLAKKKEKETKMGIKYFVYDAINLPKIGEFDLITAVFLLHYAKTKEDLVAMCKSIYKNLKNRGRFIDIINNPLYPLQPYKKYDFTREAKVPVKEGNVLKTTIYTNGHKTCSFNTYFWKKETYETAFKKAGFKTIKWHNPLVSQEGINTLGYDFWKDFLDRPPTTVLECIK